MQDEMLAPVFTTHAAAARHVDTLCHHALHLRRSRRPDILVRFLRNLQEDVQGRLLACVALIHGLGSFALPIQPPSTEVS